MDDANVTRERISRELVAKQEIELLRWLGAKDTDDAFRIIREINKLDLTVTIEAEPLVMDFVDSEGAIHLVANQIIRFKLTPLETT